MSSRRSKHTKHHHRLQQTGCTPPYASSTIFSLKIKRSSKSQRFPSTWSPTLPLSVNSKSSPLCGVQVSFSRTQIYQIASYGLHNQMVAPLRLPTYLTQGIKSTVVHWNGLHWAQAPVTESSVANQTGWVIWTFSLPSWRTTAFNLSLSWSQTWDSCSSLTFMNLSCSNSYK